MNIYCLFCEKYQCDFLVTLCQTLFPCRAIYPKQVQHIRQKGGGYKDVVHDLLPGYVFLYFEEEKPDMSRLLRLNGVIRCLSDTDRQRELTGDDAAFALNLLNNNGIIGKTRVYQEGDRIQISSGAFEGLAARIIKVDRRTSRMQIEIPFARQMVKTWVEYELVTPE